MCTDAYEVVVVKNTFVDVETVQGAGRAAPRSNTLPHSFAISLKLKELLDEFNGEEEDGTDGDFFHFGNVSNVKSEDLSEVSTEVRSEPSDGSDGSDGDGSDGESEADSDEEFEFGHSFALASLRHIHSIPQVFVTPVNDEDLVPAQTAPPDFLRASTPIATPLEAREMAEYRQVFEYADKDGDGFINAGELGCVLSPFFDGPNDLELQDLVNDVDSSCHGKIGFDDFLAWLSSQATCDDDELTEAFALFSQDRDGLIDAAGLTRTLAKLGEKITLSEATTAIRAFDRDGDGHINFCDFVQMMT